MNWIALNWWPLFTALFMLLLLTALWMAKVATHFRLNSQRVFTIFDLQLPPSEKSFVLLLQDITKNETARKKLKQHLLIDFLFMPAVYLCIALLCFRTGMKMSVGKWIFLFLAATQLAAWLFDIIENVYLWKKVTHPPTTVPHSNTEKSKSFGTIQFLVKAKFIIAFTGAACSVFGLLYYWIMGQYQTESLYWLAGMVALVVVFFLTAKSIKKPAVG